MPGCHEEWHGQPGHERGILVTDNSRQVPEDEDNSRGTALGGVKMGNLPRLGNKRRGIRGKVFEKLLDAGEDSALNDLPVTSYKSTKSSPRFKPRCEIMR